MLFWSLNGGNEYKYFDRDFGQKKVFNFLLKYVRPASLLTSSSLRDGKCRWDRKTSPWKFKASRSVFELHSSSADDTHKKLGLIREIHSTNIFVYDWFWNVSWKLWLSCIKLSTLFNANKMFWPFETARVSKVRNFIHLPSQLLLSNHGNFLTFIKNLWSKL